MLNKYFIFIVVFIYSQCAFALDRCELNIDFFSKFNDECLVYYINLALNNNHSAKQASARVEQFRQQSRISLGKELPSFSVAADYLGVHVPVLNNFSLSRNAFILPFFVSYEPDFLLKNRDKTRSKNKEFEASKYYEKAVYIALLSDVATVYTNILEYDALVEIQEEYVVIASKILDYNNKKYPRGIITSTVLNNSQKQLETLKNELENLKKQRQVLLMQLAVLTGICPEDLNLVRGSLNDFDYHGIVPNEVCSDVIFSRPDVMQAEADLEKAKIDINVARKEFFPNFNLTGIWAFNTIAPGNFFSWESSLAALLLGASQDIFKGGRKIANLKYQKAKYEELFENYRQTDLEALKEVNTALCFIKHDSLIDKNTIRKAQFESKNLNNSKRKLDRGIISTPEYLDDLSSFLSVQKEALQTKNQRLINYFTLYKALGGKL